MLIHVIKILIKQFSLGDFSLIMISKIIKNIKNSDVLLLV